MGKLKSAALRKIRKSSEATRKESVKKAKRPPLKRSRPTFVPTAEQEQEDDEEEEEDDDDEEEDDEQQQDDEELKEEDNSFYGSQEYWDSRHAQDTDFDAKFEWFLSYAELKPILQASKINYKDRTSIFVDLGCGTSRFLSDLKTDGFRGSCVGIDYSKSAISKMKQRQSVKGVDYCQGDAATSLRACVRGANVILDKSLMDCMLHNGEAQVELMLQEVFRTLSAQGVFVLVTQLDPRKEKDGEFLQRLVIANLCALEPESDKFLRTVTCHVTTCKQSSSSNLLPVPSVLVFQFEPSKLRKPDTELEMELVEYEADE